MTEDYKKNGKGALELLSIFNNPTGRVDTIDTKENELIVLKPGGKVIEFMGMVKGGKSKHIQLLCENLKKDVELTDILGKPIEIEVFKPNSLVKILYEKDPHTRALYNEAIIHLHGLVLNTLYLRPKGDVNINTREINLALMDRGPSDDLVWTSALHDYKFLLSENFRDAQLTIARNLERYVDLVIGVNVSIREAMKREGEREGTVMNLPFLQKLYRHYEQLSRESKEMGQPSGLQNSYLDIDGTADLEANATMIYKRVKGLCIPQEMEELRYSQQIN